MTESVDGDLPVPPPLPPPPDASDRLIDGPQAHHRPLERVGSIATSSIIASIITVAITIPVDIWQYRIYGRLIDGVPLTLDEAERFDNLQMLTYAIAAVVGLVAVMAWLVWFHRAYRNFDDERGAKRATWWAIGSWFIPFLNLWRPSQLMAELLAETRKFHGRDAPLRMWIWWWCFVSGWIFGRATGNVDIDTFDGVRLSATLSIIQSCLMIVAGLFVLPLMRCITMDQTERETGERRSLHEDA